MSCGVPLLALLLSVLSTVHVRGSSSSSSVNSADSLLITPAFRIFCLHVPCNDRLLYRLFLRNGHFFPGWACPDTLRSLRLPLPSVLLFFFCSSFSCLHSRHPTQHTSQSPLENPGNRPCNYRKKVFKHQPSSLRLGFRCKIHGPSSVPPCSGARLQKPRSSSERVTVGLPLYFTQRSFCLEVFDLCSGCFDPQQLSSVLDPCVHYLVPITNNALLALLSSAAPQLRTCSCLSLSGEPVCFVPFSHAVPTLLLSQPTSICALQKPVLFLLHMMSGNTAGPPATSPASSGPSSSGPSSSSPSPDPKAGGEGEAADTKKSRLPSASPSRRAGGTGNNGIQSDQSQRKKSSTPLRQGVSARKKSPKPFQSTASSTPPVPSSPIVWDSQEVRRYEAEVLAVLHSFDKAKEWADLNNCLQKLLRVFSHPGTTVASSYAPFSTLGTPPFFPFVPHKAVVAKRLAQCLNPLLPSGVHTRALETYAAIFERIGPDGLSKDLATYSAGLLPFFQDGATHVKPLFLDLINAYYLPLGKHRLGNPWHNPTFTLSACHVVPTSPPTAWLLRRQVGRKHSSARLLVYFLLCLLCLGSFPSGFRFSV